MQAQHLSAGVAADLKHAVGGYRLRRAARVVVIVRIRNQKAQGVVAAAQIQDDQMPAGRTLGPGKLA